MGFFKKSFGLRQHSVPETFVEGRTGRRKILCKRFLPIDLFGTRFACLLMREHFPKP